MGAALTYSWREGLARDIRHVLRGIVIIIVGEEENEKGSSRVQGSREQDCEERGNFKETCGGRPCLLVEEGECKGEEKQSEAEEGSRKMIARRVGAGVGQARSLHLSRPSME